MTDHEDMLARRDRCTRFLDGHGPVTAADAAGHHPG